MNVATLQALNDDEFADELSENLGFGCENWPLFRDPQLARRSLGVVEELCVKVEMQLAKHAGEDPEWEQRAGNFHMLVTLRLKQLNRQVHNSEGSQWQREHNWKTFAHDLAEIVEDSNLAAELDELEAPYGGISARQWVERRREKAAAKTGAAA